MKLHTYLIKDKAVPIYVADKIYNDTRRVASECIKEVE